MHILFLVPGDVIVEEGSLRAEDIGGPETVADLHTRFKVESQYIRNYLEGEDFSHRSESRDGQPPVLPEFCFFFTFEGGKYCIFFRQ